MKNKISKGTTLLEMLMVLAILSVFFGIAASGNDIRKQFLIMNMTAQVTADIRTARVRSLNEGAMFGIRFESPSTYTLFRFNDCNKNRSYDARGCSGGAREEKDAIVKNIVPSIVLKRSDDTDLNNYIIIFDDTGLARGATGSLGMITMILKNNGSDSAMKCITISATRVRHGSWTWDKKKGNYSCR